MKYRLLKAGELLEIGDEYLHDGRWAALTEADYRELVGFRHYYDPEEGMCSFRRGEHKATMYKTLTADILREVEQSILTRLFGS